jgi:hypothetical protein
VNHFATTETEGECIVKLPEQNDVIEKLKEVWEFKTIRTYRGNAQYSCMFALFPSVLGVLMQSDNQKRIQPGPFAKRDEEMH